MAAGVGGRQPRCVWVGGVVSVYLLAVGCVFV